MSNVTRHTSHVIRHIYNSPVIDEGEGRWGQNKESLNQVIRLNASKGEVILITMTSGRLALVPDMTAYMFS